MMVVAVEPRVWHLLDPGPGGRYEGLNAAAMVHLAARIGRSRGALA